MSPIHIEAASASTVLPTLLPTLMTLDQAAFNRERQGGRTAPSAYNWKEIDVYAVLAEGAYR
ncbi:hypothetical protein WKW80_32730 [Variovorax humicola]|uniref:Uncharacterized protein n=1 Tax=Variovorax humicola TaxID=1769758 RepID=A0ABU8W9K2_9BURK